MRGDFSKLSFPERSNFTGVLYQQGRVRLDQDDNAEHFIDAELRRILGQDVIGAGVAAVPADDSAGFRVTQAAASATGVNITVMPGHVWIDGLKLQINAGSPVVLPARYFGPPVQDPEANVSSIAADVRDAVILEMWEEAISAYQHPLDLLEPALGGPDTTERIQLHFALRLFRLGENENCRTIAGRLKNNLDSLGKLTVTPSPVVVIGGDCPVDTGGGYTGLEHYLYRIEIAAPGAAGEARFKWSRFNGGLTGRGSINATGDEVNIIANHQMINHCGLTNFYLEALSQPGPNQPWQVAFTANASLVSDGVLSLTNSDGTWPAAANVPVFFRLWDGILPIADFTDATELENGIQLEFEPPSPGSGASNYRIGDFWAFPVRAAGVGFDPSIWPNNAPPQGIIYHRAPLAEIHWTGPAPVTVTAPDNIQDCRRPFPPLTRARGCCTYSVGDGITSFGDFNTVEEAIASLPANGGNVCLLPGIHLANAHILRRRNIKIHGCGQHTIVIPRPRTRQQPVFRISDSVCITITNLTIVTLTGTAVVVDATDAAGSKEIEITHNRIIATVNGILVVNGEEVGIRWNRIRIVDRVLGLEAIVMMAEGAWIERNDVGVIPAERNPPDDGGDGPGRPRPEDPCADPEPVYTIPGLLVGYVNFVFTAILVFLPQNPFRALGGIRLSSGAERVRVLENLINGGAGDGIHLGGVVMIASGEEEDTQPRQTTVNLAFAGIINGTVRSEGQPLGGITLSFRRTDNTGQQIFLTTATDGTFATFNRTITPGPYLLRVETPGYTIANVSSETGDTPSPNGPLFRIDLRPEQRPTVTVGGHSLSEILIERNDIGNMGLSGIGSSGSEARSDVVVRAATAASQFGTPVFDLEISGNHIHHCLQNPFTEALLQIAAIKGLGGISLGICDEVTIGNNRIEHCGRRHIDPVTGIFAALVDHVEVRDNTIHNNGSFSTSIELDVRAGIRGGIVLRAMALAARGADNEIIPAVDQPAARIFGNVVRQPLGQALSLFALGPVAVENNFFSSDRRGIAQLENIAGTVLIMNLAARESVVKGQSGATLALASSSRLTPDGKTLYVDNQVRLGVTNDGLTCQFIYTRGDLGYDSNQADYLGPGRRLTDTLAFFINTMLGGQSIRASDNRFKESFAPPRSPVASLISASTLMNITSGNQGDHCIFATNQGGIPVINNPNQVLDATLCSQLSTATTAVISQSSFSRGI